MCLRGTRALGSFAATSDEKGTGMKRLYTCCSIFTLAFCAVMSAGCASDPAPHAGASPHAAASERVVATPPWPKACDDLVQRGARARVALLVAEEEKTEVDQATPSMPSRDELAPCAAAIPTAPEWILVPALLARDEEPSGLHVPASQLIAMGRTRGRTTQTPVGRTYNALAFIDPDGAPVVVHAELFAPIDVVLPSPDGRFIALLHHVGARYSGAIVPPYLNWVRLSVLDRATLETTSFQLSDGKVSVQSVIVAWDGATLDVMLRDVWNGYSDKRTHLRCAAPELQCAASDPFLVDGRIYAEISATMGERVEPLPKGMAIPDDADPRSVRVSPNGARIAYVREGAIDTELQTFERRLIVLSQGEEIEVARGPAALHARFLDDDRLAYDAPPTLTPRYLALRGAVPTMTRDDLIARAPDVATLSEPEQEALVQQQNAELAFQADLNALRALPPDVGFADLQHEALHVFDIQTRKNAPLSAALVHARLIAQPRRPNLRGSAGRIEVPLLPTAPPR
jgi:hypothetical protein